MSTRGRGLDRPFVGVIRDLRVTAEPGWLAAIAAGRFAFVRSWASFVRSLLGGAKARAGRDAILAWLELIDAAMPVGEIDLDRLHADHWLDPRRPRGMIAFGVLGRVDGAHLEAAVGMAGLRRRVKMYVVAGGEARFLVLWKRCEGLVSVPLLPLPEVPGASVPVEGP